MQNENLGQQTVGIPCILLRSVFTINNYCFSLYLNIGGLQEYPGKSFDGPGKSWNILRVLLSVKVCMVNFCFFAVAADILRSSSFQSSVFIIMPLH